MKNYFFLFLVYAIFNSSIIQAQVDTICFVYQAGSHQNMGYVSSTHTLKITNDSTFKIEEEYFFGKKNKDFFSKSKTYGKWSISKDTLIIHYRDNNLDEIGKYLIKKKKLLKIYHYKKDSKRFYRTYRQYFRNNFVLLKWKRVSPKKNSFKITPNK